MDENTGEGNPLQQCVICGSDHNFENCPSVQITEHVQDTEIPSRARLTLPHFLTVDSLSDGSSAVVTTAPISQGTLFGPVQAAQSDSCHPSNPFLLRVMPELEGEPVKYLEICDENKCNWLMFVRPAEKLEEQNLICYQLKCDIYYLTIKDIAVGEELKVWYSPHYGLKMGIAMLTEKLEPDDSNTLGKSDLNSLIKKQQNIIDRKIWTCKLCSQTEKHVLSFAKHMLKHYRIQLKKTCEICNSSFSNTTRLRNHLKIVHAPMPQDGLTRQVTVSTVGSNDNDLGLGGPLLNNIFSDSSEFPQNDDLVICIDDPTNLLLDNDSLMVENLLSDNVKDLDHFNFEIDDNQKQYVCDVCLRPFAKLKLLVLHLKRHTAQFVCYKCLKIFSRNENLRNHVCNRTLKHQCNTCDKKFTQRKYLLRHLQVIHKRKFACNLCEKVYYGQKELDNHSCPKKNNAEKKTHVCSICDKAFLRKRYLKKHMATHTGKAKTPKRGDTVCEECGKFLMSRTSYYLHMKRHKEPSYGCDKCGKKFGRKDTLQVHVISCHENKHHMCDTCGKNFNTIRILKRHRKSHEDRLFSCSRCDAVFSRQNYLRDHEKSLHPMNGESFELECYKCPICGKTLKLRSSLLRHLKRTHPENNSSTINLSDLKAQTVQVKVPQHHNKNKKKKGKSKELIDVSSKVQSELDAHIDKLLMLNNGLVIHNEKDEDSLVEELQLDSAKTYRDASKEVCISIPDLSQNDQEITLDKRAYILDNGTIIQPQDECSVVMYVLDGTEGV